MMREVNLPFGVKKNLALSATIFFITATLSMLSIGVGELTASGAQAMTGSSNNQVQPYTGGAPVSKVFYPADGSTVTITCTGAVIKQSPGATPYREGWINPSTTGNLNTAADLHGRLASGSSSPYASGCPSNNKASNPAPQPTNNNQPSNQSNTATQTTPAAQAPAPSASSTSSSTANANATANANVVVADSGGGNQAPAAQKQSSTSANTSATSTPASSQSQASFSGKSLPNTGPGNVLAISGVTTVLGTIGHLLYQRLRYRSLV